MQVFPQVLINIDVTSKPNLPAVPEIARAIKEAEEELGELGRVLVRYSGTQNMCRVMVEGPSDEVTQRLADIIATAVRATIG
jgi:phosphoglucosamine mutase